MKLNSLVLFSFVFFVLSGKTSCDSNGSGNEIDTTVLGVSHHCKNDNVCQVDCEKIIPNCKGYQKLKRTQYFKLRFNSNPIFAQAYEEVCLSRVFSDQKTEKASIFEMFKNEIARFLTPELVPKVKKLQGISSTFKFFQNSTSIPTDKRDLIMSLLKLVSIYRTFTRMCTEKPDWRERLKERIEKLSDLHFGLEKLNPELDEVPITATKEERIKYINSNLDLLYNGYGTTLKDSIILIKKEIIEDTKDFSEENYELFHSMKQQMTEKFVEYMRENFLEKSTMELCSCPEFMKYPEYIRKSLNNPRRSKEVLRGIISKIILINIPQSFPDKLYAKAKKNMLKGVKNLEKIIKKNQRLAVKYCKRTCQHLAKREKQLKRADQKKSK